MSLTTDLVFCCTVKSSGEINLIKDKIKQFNPTVLGQIYFVEWTQKVDKLLELTDIFIDTYPFGCGITLLQAMKHSCLILIPLADKKQFINIQSNQSKFPMTFAKIILILTYSISCCSANEG